MIAMKKITAAMTLVTAAFAAEAADVRLISSTPAEQWIDCGSVELAEYDNTVSHDVMVTRYGAQTMQGFGGCFNELGARH